MDVFNYTIIVLILLGALIIGLAARYVRKIFDLLQDHQLKINWKRLRLFMLIFLGGYLGTVVVVIIGETNLLVLLSGVIFFMGALFVYLVVITGLDSFKKLNEVSQYNINQAKQAMRATPAENTTPTKQHEQRRTSNASDASNASELSKTSKPSKERVANAKQAKRTKHAKKARRAKPAENTKQTKH